MYEKAGFKRMAEFEGWPEGHVNVVLCKTLLAGTPDVGSGSTTGIALARLSNNSLRTD